MSSYLDDYLYVLPAPIADMTDAILVVGEARFPVHSAMMAANSAVFAGRVVRIRARDSLAGGPGVGCSDCSEVYICRVSPTSL